MHFSQDFLRSALSKSNFEHCGNFFNHNKIIGFSIDSRTIKKGELFVAIKGHNFDGHDFLQIALDNGALGLVLNKEQKYKIKNISKKILDKKLLIFVDDTFDALKKVSKFWRQEFKSPVVGITGSVGKTTTKEILANILRVAKFNAFISFKNQNNIIGLCLNILKLNNQHNAAVFELGINDVGEMDELVDILRPDYGVITSINNAHTKGLKDLVGVAKEKKKIFKYFKDGNVGIVNGDLPLLDTFYSFPVIRFGRKTKNYIQARRIKFVRTNNNKGILSFILKVYSDKERAFLKNNHIGLIDNSLAASSAASLLKISYKDIITGVQTYKSFENRFEYKKLKSNTGKIISDCYNACPDSMKAALLSFAQLKSSGKKIAILGDMLELGKREVFWHKQVGRLLTKVDGLTDLILVGKLAKNIFKTAPLDVNVKMCKDWQQAKSILSDILSQDNSKDSLILAKASRGMQLDNLVKFFSI